MQGEFSFKNFFLYSIGRSFVLYLLIIGVSVTSIGTAIIFFTDSKDHFNSDRARIQAIESVQVPVLIEMIKTNNLLLLEKEANALVSHPNIEYVEISDQRGQLVNAQSEYFNLDSSYTDSIEDGYNTHLLHTIDLGEQVNGQTYSFGTLTIAENLDDIKQEIVLEKISTLKIQLIESLIISAASLFLFFHFVGRHLIRMENYAHTLKLGHLDKPLRTLRPVTAFNDKDEISRLNDAMNTMRLNLLAAFQKNQLAEIDQEQLIASLQAKNAELERFNYTVSHDLKSPLVTINGFIGLLEKDIKAANSEKVDKNIAIIKSAATNMHTLLNDMLELARLGHQQGQRVDISFNHLINSTLNSLAEQINSKHAVIEIEENMPIVLVEEMRFKEVFLNLIENALKYMKNQPNPVIKIGTKVIESSTGVKETAFYVEDNGRGIKPDYCKKVFELFERVAVDIEGTGVGLSIVKRIIELHDGRIWVESSGLDTGATFYFVIPLIQGANDD